MPPIPSSNGHVSRPTIRDKRLESLADLATESPSSTEDEVDAPSEGIVARRLDTYRPESVKWLWQRRFPLGKLSIIQGDPDKGKTWEMNATNTSHRVK